jgi:hypothetical protein
MWPPRRSSARSEAARAHARGGQANAVDGDRVALVQLAGQARVDAQLCAVVVAPQLDDIAEIGDQAREHLSSMSAAIRLTTRAVAPR